jgi:hypothetical protein
VTDSNLLESVTTSPVPAVLDRRSVLLLLEEEWHVDRDRYWHRFFQALDPRVPGLGRIVFAESVARLAAADNDLDPLVEQFSHANTYTQAYYAYRFTCGFATSLTALIDLRPWLRLCVTSSQLRDDKVQALAAGLLQRILQRRKPANDMRARAALAARELFLAAWVRRAPLDALPSVIDTLDVDSDHGTVLLEMIVDPTKSHPDKDDAVDQLAQRVQDLLTAPNIVGKIYEWFVTAEADAEAQQKRDFLTWYEAAQTAEAESREPPPMPSSRHYHVSRDGTHWLKEHLVEFVKAAPVLACKTFASCARYWQQTTDIHQQDSEFVHLAVSNGNFAIEARPSEGVHHHGQFLIDDMVAALVGALDTVDATQRRPIMDELVRLPAPALVWASLISGASSSEVIRDWLAPLFRNPAALRLFTKPIGDLLITARGSFTDEAKQAIAMAVASLNEDDDAYLKSSLEGALAISLGQSPTPEPEGNPTVARLDDMDTSQLIRSGLTLEEISRPENARIREESRRAWDECSRLEPYRREPARLDAAGIKQAADVLAGLRAALDAKDANTEIITKGWCALARLASLSVLLSGSPDVLVFEAGDRVDGQAPPNSDLLNAGQFIPRAAAVPGLLALAARDKNERAVAAVARLSSDPNPVVRQQIAWRLRELVELGREHVWPILERLVRDENVAVAAAATSELTPFYGVDRDAALALSKVALDRFTGPTEADREGRTDALLQLAWYHLARADAVASEAIAEAIVDLPKRWTGFNRMMQSYRGWLTMGAGDDEAEEAARRRTVDMFKRIASACIDALSTSTSGKDPNDQQRTERDPYAILLEEIAMQLYFASGAFRARNDSEPMPLETTARFYWEFHDVLTKIGAAGAVAAADRVLNTFEYLYRLSVDVKIPSSEVLRSFTRVAEAAVRAGAAQTFWTLDSIENLLRRCVAERDPALFTREMLVNWGSILDPLLDLGWEQAYRLATDLDLSR